jgi:hypothetical protein
VVRIPVYRSKGSGFDSRRYQIFLEVVSLERGTLSLVSTIEELLGRKVAASVYKTETTAVGNRCADLGTPILKTRGAGFESLSVTDYPDRYLYWFPSNGWIAIQVLRVCFLPNLFEFNID